MSLHSRLPKISGCLVLVAMGLIALFARPAKAEGYVAPKPTAQEVHWHQEFVHLFDAGHTHEAAVAAGNFEKALQGINDAQGWYILGNDWNAIAEFDRAIAAENHSLAILPNNSYAFNSLGISYLKLGKNDVAMNYFHRAAALGNKQAQDNISAIQQAQAASIRQDPSAGQSMGDKIRNVNEQLNLRSCGKYSC